MTSLYSKDTRPLFSNQKSTVDIVKLFCKEELINNGINVESFFQDRFIVLLYGEIFKKKKLKINIAESSVRNEISEKSTYQEILGSCLCFCSSLPQTVLTIREVIS